MGAERDEAFGRLLAEQRERAGLTQRELAARIGLAAATVASAELGEEPRSSTLERLLAGLPCLGARRMLLGPTARPTPACGALLELFRDVAGLRACRVSLRLSCAESGSGRTELAIEGLRAPDLDPDDPATLRQLVRAVHRGSPDSLRDVTWPAPGAEASVDVRDGSVTHSWRIPARVADGLAYRRSEAVAVEIDRLDPDDGSGLFHAPGYPIDTLTLALRSPPGRGPSSARHEARPVSLGGELALPPLPPRRVSLARDVESGEIRVDVASPLPHLAHWLAWSDDAATPSPAPLPPGLDLAARLRAAREREGLSARALAALLQTGAATISGADGGRDVRRSTLRAYLDALPGLHPDELLPEPAAAGPSSRREAWEMLRALHGMEAERETKRLRIARDGTASVSYVTEGLRRLDKAGSPLVVRYGADPLARGQVTPPSILEPLPSRGPAPTVRTRLIRLADGLTIHQLTFDAESAARGVSHERRVELGRAFATSREEASGPLGPGVDGTTLTAAFPVRALEIEVALPPSLKVREVRALAWPSLVVPRDGGAALAQRLHPEGLQARWEAGRRLARLVVPEPLIGVRYALAWVLA